MTKKEKFKLICPKCSSENTNIYFNYIHEEIVCECKDCEYDDADYDMKNIEYELWAEEIMDELGLKARDED